MDNRTNKASQKARRIGDPPRQRLYSIKDAALYLGRTEWGVRELIWNGEFPVLKTGRKIYIDVFDMDAWIEKRKETVL